MLSKLFKSKKTEVVKSNLNKVASTNLKKVNGGGEPVRGAGIVIEQIPGGGRGV